MVAIKDFGMPSCCENCNMCFNRNLDTFYCCITLNDVNIDEKAHDCPLVEIEEHKEEKWIPVVNVDNSPFDNVKERKGKWIKTGGSFRCSECMGMPEFKDIRTLKFCPNCGADMRGAKNE